MNLIAIDQFTYDGKTVRVGDEFEAPDAHAILLTRALRAVEAPKTDAPKTKRKYRRRDMRPEV